MIKLNFKNTSNLGSFVALVAFSSFAMMDLIMKVTSEKVSVLTMIVFVNFFVVIWSIIIGLIFNINWIKTKNLPFHILRGIISVIVSFTVFSSFKILGLSVAYSLVFLAPIFNVLWSHIFLKESPTRFQLFGVLFGFIGVLIALRPGATILNIGHLYAIISAIGISLNALVTRKWGKKEHPFTFGIYSGLMIVCIYLWPVIKITNFSQINIYTYLVFMMLGAHFLLNATMLTFAIQNTNLTIIGSLQFTQLVWGFILEFLFLSIYPTTWLMAGSIVVVIGGLMVTNQKMFKKTIYN